MTGPGCKRIRTIAAALLALAALAACGGRPPVPPPGPPAAARLLAGPACLDALAARGSVFAKVPDVATGRGCRVDTAVSLSRSTADLDAPVVMGCTLALALNDFERDVIQPAAQRHFGQHVAGVDHRGAYACRSRAGGGRLSEHALGRAIDIAGFRLRDGTRIRVDRDWNGGGREAAFLHDVARQACGLFSVVLTPNHDRDHRDHIHLDLGPWRLCGV